MSFYFHLSFFPSSHMSHTQIALTGAKFVRSADASAGAGTEANSFTVGHQFGAKSIDLAFGADAFTTNNLQRSPAKLFATVFT